MFAFAERAHIYNGDHFAEHDKAVGCFQEFGHCVTEFVSSSIVVISVVILTQLLSIALAQLMATTCVGIWVQQALVIPKNDNLNAGVYSPWLVGGCQGIVKAKQLIDRISGP